ncbi:hypothetical protein BKA25_002078 [Actinoalloteichus hymeniacidonis]|nr:hypothetical protein [Actinoalloteichus hymeniacidonis]
MSIRWHHPNAGSVQTKMVNPVCGRRAITEELAEWILDRL